jgi:Domain of unknown function (DUF4440)
MGRPTNRRAIIHAITVGLACFTPGIAVEAVAGSRIATRAEILALHKKFADAYITADRVALDRLLDDRLVFVHGNGRSLTKAQVLSDLDRAPGAPEPPVKVTDIKLAEGYEVFLFDGIAVLTGVNELTFLSKGADGSPVSRLQPEVFSFIWTRTQAGWKLLLFQTTRQP